MTQRALEQRTDQKPVLYECKKWDVENSPQVMLNGFKALHVKKRGEKRKSFLCEWVWEDTEINVM